MNSITGVLRYIFFKSNELERSSELSKIFFIITPKMDIKTYFNIQTSLSAGVGPADLIPSMHKG
jgi:hypothetical protein